MEDLAALISSQGWWITLGALLLFNIKHIICAAQDIGKWLLPSYKERWEARQVELEREHLATEHRYQERIDTILTLKDMLLAYKTELDDYKLARQQSESRMFEMIRAYERSQAKVVEVLRDQSDNWHELSEHQRAQTKLLGQISQKLTDLRCVGGFQEG